MSSLFGGNTATQAQGQPAGTGLFGSSNAQQPSGASSLFGGQANAQNQGSSPFGGSTAQNQQPSGGASLFGGNAATQNQPQSSSLFGGNAATQNQPQSSSLFGGAAASQNQPATSLFGGGNTTTQNQPANTGTNLFGNTQPASNTTATGGSSLFGGNTATNTTTQQGSLFTQPTTMQQSSLYQPQASSNTAPQQIHLSTLLQSGLGGHPSSTMGALGSLSQQDLARSRLAAANIASRPNEKPVIDQVQTLIRKWDPNSLDTLNQTYLYNAVNAAYAPFYYRNVDEQEEAWEGALAKKPANMSLDNGDVAFVPILVRGFKALGERVEYQARTVNEFRGRLHEMNNSLDTIMKRHEQNITLRIENARRQHAVLSQRCLRLAVKAQVLKNKNYPLDSSEENLRKTLMELEKRVFDPSFQAREEEIWARMMALRERARWLEDEGKRLGTQVEEQKKDGGSGISEEVLQKTKRILKDYDGQLRHLAHELEEVRGQFGDWQEAR